MELLLELIEYNAEISYRAVFALVGVGFLFLWLSLVIWVWADSGVFFKSYVYRLFFTVNTLLFGFVGLIVYLLFRFSSLNKVDTDQEHMDLFGMGLVSCPDCESLNPLENYYCVNCGKKLQSRCPDCNYYVRLGDSFCADCGASLESDKSSSESVEKYAILRYIRDVFSKITKLFLSIFKRTKRKRRKNKKDKSKKKS